MKKEITAKLISVLALFMIVFSAYGQATKDISIRGTFKGLSISENFKVSYEQNTSTPSATLFGPEDLLEHVIYSIDKEGVLSFSFDKNFKIAENRVWNISVILNGPALDFYSAQANGKISILTPSTHKNLQVNVSSNGEIKFSQPITITGNLNITCSSDGNLYFERTTNCQGDVEILLSSAGSVIFNSLTAGNVIGNISSASVLTINDLKAENVNIESYSASNVVIKGIADKGEFNAMSASTIDIKNLKINTEPILNSNSASNIIM